MPCRDDYRDGPTVNGLKQAQKQVQRLQERNDELAVENCALRAFICSNYDQLNTDALSEQHTAILKKALKDQKTHRGEDKRRAIEQLSKEVEERKKRVSQIKKLGGVASEELLAEIKDFRAKLADVHKSNPMMTDLY